MKVPFELPTTNLSDVREGDLVFCTKDSLMQRLLTAVGDPWRHVAMALEVDGELCIGEVSGGHKIISRSLEEALESYDLVATARVTGKSPSCLAAAADWVRSYLDSSQLYAWDDVLLVGLILATRRALRVDKLDVLADTLQQVSMRAPQAEHPSMTCSSFIFEAFNQTGDCRLSVPIGPMDAEPSVGRRQDLPDLTGALTMDDAERQAVFDGASILELLGDSEGYDDGLVAEVEEIFEDFDYDPDGPVPMPSAGVRGNGKSSASPSQISRFARIVVDLVDEYGRSYRGGVDQSQTAQPGQLDGRWVSPGDLWRSDTMDGRTYLKR